MLALTKGSSLWFAIMSASNLIRVAESYGPALLLNRHWCDQWSKGRRASPLQPLTYKYHRIVWIGKDFLRCLSPTVDLIPPRPLNHVPQHHVYVGFCKTKCVDMALVLLPSVQHSIQVPCLYLALSLSPTVDISLPVCFDTIWFRFFY